MLGPMSVSTLVFAELLYGARNSSREDENTARVWDFARSVMVVDFDASSADAYASVRFTLRRLGKPVPVMDLLIASTALSRGARLATDDRGHFSSIPGLHVENWLS
ncbi:MAG: type II toxin-antitoxin system VapC family toxin [Planctomycetota bacterium]|nr:type II toxin-antitoxin system VapC family toxin [Planctomycetota bacterium]